MFNGLPAPFTSFHRKDSPQSQEPKSQKAQLPLGTVTLSTISNYFFSHQEPQKAQNAPRDPRERNHMCQSRAKHHTSLRPFPCAQWLIGLVSHLARQRLCQKRQLPTTARSSLADRLFVVSPLISLPTKPADDSKAQKGFLGASMLSSTSKTSRHTSTLQYLTPSHSA